MGLVLSLEPPMVIGGHHDNSALSIVKKATSDLEVLSENGWQCSSILPYRTQSAC